MLWGAARAHWPACEAVCGIFLEDPDVAVATASLEGDTEVQLPDPVIPEDPLLHNETWREGRVVAWTDGAGRRNQDPRLRRAGAGIYYAQGHVMNVAMPLPRRIQTNQRAELHAIIKAVERERRP